MSMPMHAKAGSYMVTDDHGHVAASGRRGNKFLSSREPLCFLPGLWDLEAAHRESKPGPNQLMPMLQSKGLPVWLLLELRLLCKVSRKQRGDRSLQAVSIEKSFSNPRKKLIQAASPMTAARAEGRQAMLLRARHPLPQPCKKQLLMQSSICGIHNSRCKHSSLSALQMGQGRAGQVSVQKRLSLSRSLHKENKRGMFTSCHTHLHIPAAESMRAPQP